jgi:hypothetical protein
MFRITYAHNRVPHQETISRFVKHAAFIKPADPAPRIPSATPGALTTTSRVAVSTTVLLFLAVCIFPLTAHAAILSNPPNNLGLVGYWTFDEGSGSTAYDHSGNGNNGTLVNSPTWVAGKVGGALSFNGTNQYVQGNDTTLPQGASPRTMSAWIKTTTSGTSWFLSYGTDSTGNASGMFVSGGNLYATTWLNDLNSGITVNNNSWHFVVATYDGTTWRTYVDSVAGATNSPSTNTTGGNLKIGTRQDLTQYFSGTIDDVRIYNRALSANDVANLYTAGRTTRNTSPTTLLTNGLVGYWTFDGHTVNWGSNTVADVSGNGNTGTLINMSTSTSPTIGKIGQALQFNGTNQYISLSDAQMPSGASRRTMCAWFKTSLTGAIYQTVFSYGTTGVGGETSEITIFANNDFHGGNINSFGASQWGDGVASNVNNADGKWHQGCATFDGSTWYVYVDGSFRASKAMATNTVLNTAYIGRDNAGSYFRGSIDDVRIYNRALSATEIQELYQAGGGVTQDASNPQVLTNGGLVGHWSFDGKYMNWATNQALDSSGQGNNGTLVNMSTTTSPTRGVIGQALSFNGTSSTVTISNATSLQLNGSFSACVWTRIESSATQVILEQWYPSVGWHIGIASNVIFSDVDGTNANRIQSGTLLLHTWYDVCLIYNGTSQTLYINGSSVASHASGASPGSSQPIYIGSNGVNSFFSGALDDVRIYNRALSPQEVQTLYDLGR